MLRGERVHETWREILNLFEFDLNFSIKQVPVLQYQDGVVHFEHRGFIEIVGKSSSNIIWDLDHLLRGVALCGIYQSMYGHLQRALRFALAATPGNATTTATRSRTKREFSGTTSTTCRSRVYSSEPFLNRLMCGTQDFRLLACSSIIVIVYL